MPTDQRDQWIQSLLAKTEGCYERTIAELENWLECGLAVAEKTEKEPFVPFEV